VFGWVKETDVEGIAGAKSAGTHYWQNFRKRYSGPLHVDAPPKEGAPKRRAKKAKLAEEEAVETPLCPVCLGSDAVRRSGKLSHYDWVAVDPEADLWRCFAKEGGCGLCFRGDSLPYTETTGQTRTWDEMPPRPSERREIVKVGSGEIESAADFEVFLQRLASSVNTLVEKSLATVDRDALLALAAQVASGPLQSHRDAAKADVLARQIRECMATIDATFQPYTAASDWLHKAFTRARGDLKSSLQSGLADIDRRIVDWSEHVEKERRRIEREDAAATAEAAALQDSAQRKQRSDAADRMLDMGDVRGAAELRNAPLPPVAAPPPPPPTAASVVVPGTKVKREWIVDDKTAFDVDKLVSFVHANPVFRRALVTLNVDGAAALAKSLGQDNGTTDFPLESGVVPRFEPKVKRR
jgi:hypothetical protein